MRWLLVMLPAISLGELCAVEEFGLGDGEITVHNGDGQRWPLTVSDTPTCFAGMKTDLNGNSTRTFPIAEEGAYLCVGQGGGVRVEDGRRYTIRGGAVALDP
ncbi:MAG: hypothetical protein EA397_16210 [Deltaproteobacteria bacterium]|nr:MAG: hypothetical protein EA397_16210 [Deltaproteobacteria bacterium]